ncbi:CLUMA_CG002482, isoform A [Clunio marinus]|uniref:CLUMA_CG002482, isoform A n=1 Tax=Clunio marinus TaxID=568069 RepID=A0A1J1HRH4_9DIPT|nr:CLUMA_CG002482, isoform A [Clunio marinus]
MSKVPTYEDFCVDGKKVVDYICDYVKDIAKRDVIDYSLKPNFLHSRLAKEMPVKGEKFDKIMTDFNRKIMPGVLNWMHPNFYAYFGAGNAYPSVIGEMLSSAISSVGFSWASCPSLTELEQIVLDWFAKALDLPPFYLSKTRNLSSIGGGAIQNSASDSIFAAMAAARHRAIKTLQDQDSDRDAPPSKYLPKLVCFASLNAHSSVEKAAKILMVKLYAVEPNQEDSMTAVALEKAIKETRDKGLVPFFVLSTAGTTGQSAFDDIEKIGNVCKKYPSIWFHVDGAYGGNSFIVPEMRHLKRGMALTDSFNVNPNKLLLTAFDCSCLWVKDMKTFLEAYIVGSVDIEDQISTGIVDLHNFGVPWSRRFRALKLYFMFRMYGLKALQDYIRRVIKVGEHFAQLVKADTRFRVKNKPILGLVCFRLVGKSDETRRMAALPSPVDRLNEILLKKLNETNSIHLIPSHAQGKYVIRFVANQENCSEEQVEKAWRLIQETATKVLSSSSPHSSSMIMNDPFSKTRYLTSEQHESSPRRMLWDGASPVTIITDKDDDEDEDEDDDDDF